MRNAKPLTEKQKDILNFIETYIEDFGYPPSIRDIQNNCDISSTSVVKYNLDRLQEKGLMNRDSEISRSISLTNSEKSQTIKVPVLGTITAGQPFPMVEDSRWDVDELESLRKRFCGQLDLISDAAVDLEKYFKYVYKLIEDNFI